MIKILIVVLCISTIILRKPQRQDNSSSNNLGTVTNNSQPTLLTVTPSIEGVNFYS